MKYRRQLRQTGAASGPVDPLERYLKRSGFFGEAALARRARQEPDQQLKLEEALRRQKPHLPISPDLDEMEALLRTLFGGGDALVLRRMRAGLTGRELLLVGVNGMVDRKTAQQAVEGFLGEQPGQPDPPEPDAFVDWLLLHRSSVPKTKVEARFDRLLQALLNGETLVFVAGSVRALQCSTPGWESRAIEEPETEGVIRGPREGFTEALATNTSLLRRRLRNERLRMEAMRIGEISGTRVAMAYISGVCKQPLVDEVRRRLSRIKTDGIIDSGYIEEFIEDTPWTLFPLIKNTERPDVVAGALLEGRVAILVDGSPFVLTVPTSFNDMMQAPEDYYERFPVVTMLRVMRWMFAAVALLGPAFYVAFTTFHHEMLPTSLLLSIMAAREGVPFPAMIEALLMEIAFEALREAGVRMPKNVGQAISIVGALVIGQAAVQAGFVSAPMVIVVSLTGLASFIIPKFSAAIPLRMLRFGMLILAGTFGAYGITLGIVLVVLHLLSLRSFGAPYYAPLGPVLPSDLDDMMYRAPHWANRSRPTDAEQLDPVRTAEGLKPGPPEEGES